MPVAAVFWDRDNTLIRDPGYISSPEQVELLPGSADALRMLSQAGFENVIVTNQSGIARGLFDESALERIHDRMVGLFAKQGARIDAIYHCPYLDGEEAKVEKYRKNSDLRKPNPGMILKASLERKIDLAGSWMIGDALHDVQAGRAAGCRTILIRKADATETPRKGGDADFVADSAQDAAKIVLKYTRTVESQRASGGSRENPTTADMPGAAGESTAVLQEILTFLRTVDRRSRADEFSLGKLLGAVAQILVIGVVVWALFAWLRGEINVDLLARLELATLLQLVALTCFSLSPRR